MALSFLIYILEIKSYKWMKQFTIKDFIAYNNPCFSCGESIHFNFVSNEENNTAGLKPTVKQEYTTVNLKRTYEQTLQLQVIHHSNRFASTNSKDLVKYLSDHKLSLSSNCGKCLTHIESQYLDFNLDKGYILPVGISRENLIVSEDSFIYHVYSSYFTGQSMILVDRLDKPTSHIRLDIPLLSLSKIKNRERLINKIKTYMIFT